MYPKIITDLKRENRMQMKLAFTNFNCVIILIMTVQCTMKQIIRPMTTNKINEQGVLY